MGCNCKTKEKTDKLIKTIEELDNSKSKNYVTTNKTKLKIFFSFISGVIRILYFICFILFILFALVFMIITRKSISLKINNFIRHEKQ